MEYTCPWCMACMALCGSIREGVSKKRNRGSGGKGGITDNILFNYCLNKNIVFLKERNQFKSNKTREKKEMKSKHLICKRANEETKERKENKNLGNPGKETTNCER